MKKRLLASLMCLCLLVGLLPTAAMAAEGEAPADETPASVTETAPGAEEPDMDTAEPDTDTAEPDTDTAEPDTDTAELDMGAVEPVLAVTEAEETAGADTPAEEPPVANSPFRVTLDGTAAECADWAATRTLLEAVSSSGVHTVKIELLDDAEITDDYIGISSYRFQSGSTFELDLGGHMLTRTAATQNKGTGKLGSTTYYPVVYAGAGQNWTIRNGSISAKTEAQRITMCGVLVGNSGQLNMEAVSLNGGKSNFVAYSTLGIGACNRSSITMVNCSIKGFDVGVQNQSDDSQTAVMDISVSSSCISANKTGVIINPNRADVTIRNTSISVENGSGLRAETYCKNKRNIVLENVDIQAHATSATSTSTSYGIYLSRAMTIEVVVKGENSRVFGTHGAVYSSCSASADGVYLEAGKFGAGGSVEREAVLSGGDVYFAPANQMLAETAGEDGYYTLVTDENMKPVASLDVDGTVTEYYSMDGLSRALNSEENKGKEMAVKLLEDVEYQIFKLFNSATVDLNGKTLTGYIDLEFDKGITVTLKDSSKEQTGKISAPDSHGQQHAIRNNGGKGKTASTLIIESGTYECAVESGMAIYSSFDTNVIIRGGTFIGGNSVFYYYAGTPRYYTGSIALEGGSFYTTAADGTLFGLKTYQGAHVTIPEGKLLVKTAPDLEVTQTKITLSNEADAPAAVEDGDGNQYASLEAAISAAGDTATLKLITPVISFETVTVPEGKTVTLDLNGQMYEAYNGPALKVAEGGALTIRDSAGNNSGSIVSPLSCVDVAGSLTIESGTLRGVENVVTVTEMTAQPASITVNGGLVEENQDEKTGASAIYTSENANFTLAVTGGTIRTVKGGYLSDAPSMAAITLKGSGTANISGGTITGPHTALYAVNSNGGISVNMTDGALSSLCPKTQSGWGGEVVSLSGGTHSFTGGTITAARDGENTSNTSVGVAVRNGADVTLAGNVQVKGTANGDISAAVEISALSSLRIAENAYLESNTANGTVVDFPTYGGTPAGVKVEGGILINQKNANGKIFDTDKEDVKKIIQVTGGSFGKDIRQELPNHGLTTQKDTADNLYDLVVAQINGTNYTSLEEALTAAGETNETTITLLADVNVREDTTIPSNVTLAGDKTVTAMDNATLTMNGKVSGSAGGPTFTEDGGTVKLGDGSTIPVKKLPTSIILNYAAYEMILTPKGTYGEIADYAQNTLQLSVEEVLPEGVAEEDKAVTWSSSKTGSLGLEVDTNGLVKAQQYSDPGTVVITARTPNGVTATCTVTIKLKLLDFTISPKTEAYDGSPKTFLEQTATVDRNPIKGFRNSYVKDGVTYNEPVEPGVYDLVITRPEDASFKAFKQTIPGALTIYQVIVDKKSLALNPGKTETLTASIIPEGAISESVTWASSDETVATVDENGVVTAVAAGTTTITAAAGGASGTCTVTVAVPSSGGGGGGSSSGGDYTVSADAGKHGTVTVSPKRADEGDTVTVTVKPDKNYELDELTVTDRNGDTIKLKNKGNGKFTFTMPGSKVTVEASFKPITAEPEAPVFADVPTGAYYADAVAWAVEQGITSGTSADTFSPNASCTRAQMVTFLWRANGSPRASGANPFIDVRDDAYYYEAVLWAAEQGITSGTSATTFSPNAVLTRGQTVTFLWRQAGSSVVNYAMSFTDVDAEAYYAEAVRWAVSEGITSGTGGNNFSPNANCTRAQIVTFLYRDMAM